MRPRPPLQVAVIASACALHACGAPAEPEPERDVASVATPITHGEDDDGDLAVVQLRGGLGACTGTLISSMSVLTAAHCLGPPAPSEVFFGTDLDGGGWTVPIAGLRAHPDFDPLQGTDDVGVIELAVASLVEPYAPSWRALDASAVGTQVRIVGFGVGEGHAPRRKREGQAVIDEVLETTITLAPSPSSPCTGDSGGPALETRDEGEVIVGVTSMGDLTCESMAIDTRVDAYRDFVEPHLDHHQAAASGCTTSPARGDPWPLLASAGIAVLASRLRRRLCGCPRAHRRGPS